MAVSVAMLPFTGCVYRLTKRKRKNPAAAALGRKGGRNNPNQFGPRRAHQGRQEGRGCAVREEKGGMMKFSVKLTVAGNPGRAATSYRRDFEAESPDDAARLAADYWDTNWEGPEIMTESWIYVYGYRLESSQPKEVASLHAQWDTDSYQQAKKAIAVLVSAGSVPASDTFGTPVRAVECALGLESAKARDLVNQLALRGLVHVTTRTRNKLDPHEGEAVCYWTAGPTNSMAAGAQA